MSKLWFSLVLLLSTLIVPSFAQTDPTPITLDNAAQLQEVYRFGTGTLIDAQYSPDGETVIVSTSLGLWTLALGDEDAALVPLEAPNPFYARALAISADGTLIAAGGTDFGVYVWRDGVFSADLRAHTGAVVGVGLSPDGAYVVSGGEDNALIVWDLATQAEVWRSEERTSPAAHIAFSPDSQTLLVGQRDGMVFSYDLATGELIGEGTQPVSSLRGFAISPDGSVLAGTNFRSSDYQIWDAATGEPMFEGRLPTVNGASPEGMDVAFAPDGTGVYVLPLIGDLVRVNLADGAVSTVPLAGFGAPTGRTAINLSPDGAQAAIVTSNQLFLVSLADGTIAQAVLSPASANGVDFTPDSTQLTGVFSGSLTQIWETATGALVGSTVVDGAPFNRIAYLPNGTLAALDITKTLYIDGIPLVQVINGFSNYSILEASASGVLVTQGAEGRGLRLFDAEGTQTSEWVNDAGANVTAAAISPDGTLVAYGLESTGFGVFTSADGVLVRGGSLGRGLASAVAISPDNQRLMVATGSSVLAYPVNLTEEIGSGTDQTPFVTATTFGGVSDLAISPDGALIAGVGTDNILWVWDMATGETVYSSPVLTAPLRSVVFSPDGAWLATAGDDGTVRVWAVR